MTQTEGYLVDLLKLPIGKTAYELELDNEYFRSAQYKELPDGNARVEAVFNVTEHSLRLHLKIVGTAVLICDRCLDLMDYPVELEKDFGIVYSDTEEDDDDVISVSKEWAKVDLSWLSFEQIIVNLPLVHSHQDGECNPQMQELLLSHLTTNDGQPEE